MDEITKDIQDWCILFADDIILVDKTRDGVNIKLEKWRNTLESKGFKLSKTNIKHLECKFSEGEEELVWDITICNTAIPKVERFKYLDSIIQGNGEIDDDIGHRIRVEQQKWRCPFEVLCDKKILV